MIIPMTRVQIVGHKQDMDATLRELQRLACVQLLDATQVHPGMHGYALAAEQKEIETLNYLLARLHALLALLPPLPDETPEPWDQKGLIESIQAELDAQAGELEALAQERQQLLNDAEVLPSYADTLSKLMPLTPVLTQLRDYETVAVLLNNPAAGLMDTLAAEMQEIAGPLSELVWDQVDPDHIGALLIFPREAAPKMNTLLGRLQVNPIALPESLRNVSFQDALVHIYQRLEEIPRRLKAIDVQLQESARTYRARWLGAARALNRRLEQLRARKHLAETQHTFVLVGWLPRDQLEPLRQTLEARLPQALVVDELLPTPEEAWDAPVLLTGNRFTRSFHFFIRLLSIPRYGALDPTALMALFMPLFFGLMLGDIGYGLTLLIIVLWARRRMAPGSGMRDLMTFLLFGSLWTIFFGFVFGEFFGNLGHLMLGLHPLWMERSDPDALAPLLLFTIALGGMHIMLGLALGIWQAWHLHQRHELWERAGKLVGLIGLFLLAGVVARQLPRGWMTPAAATVIVGLAMLIHGLGSVGALLAPVELLGVLGNILSYLRLAAIGLASVYLALVGNLMAGKIGVIWIGILIAVLFHTLNLAMGAFSPSIHALRLHYVEFFTKFYEEGGQPFHPFGGPDPFAS
ncbi:MAG TPA: hypothetical protein G4O05_02640 [Caldilineae bacterium]|nr:hypothetical protein [Caldilineae bacterium]